jgi:hypothetical protein
MSVDGDGFQKESAGHNQREPLDKDFELWRNVLRCDVERHGELRGVLPGNSGGEIENRALGAEFDFTNL